MLDIFGRRSNSTPEDPTANEPVGGYDSNKIAPLLNQAQQQSDRDKFYIYLLDSLDIIEELQYQLQGKVRSKDNKGQMIWVQRFDPLVNEDGIKQILNIIYSLGVNKNTLLGNFSHDEIMYKCFKVKIRVAQLVAIKWEDFDIKKEQRSLVVMIVVNTIHSGLSRCENGRLAKDLTKITTRIETETAPKGSSSQNATKGFLQSILGGK